MHDLDYTLSELELESAFEDFEPDVGEFEFELEFDDTEVFGDTEMESPFDDAEEMELASELLGVSDDAELEQFLGKLFKRVTRKVGRALKRGPLRAVGRVLKGVAKRSLPIAGRALGAYFGGPAGAAIGGRLAPAAGRLFGLELEGMSPEDAELEVARRYVRFAGTAAKKAALAPPTVHPKTVAKTAIAAAAKTHAPGLLRRTSAVSGPTWSRSGRWIRRGRKIVVLGA